MEQHLASKFCETLGMSVILYRENERADYRCLSSHLCGGASCGGASCGGAFCGTEATAARSEDTTPPASVG